MIWLAHPHEFWERVATMCLWSFGCAAGGQLLQCVGDLVEELGLSGDLALNSSRLQQVFAVLWHGLCLNGKSEPEVRGAEN